MGVSVEEHLISQNPLVMLNYSSACFVWPLRFKIEPILQFSVMSESQHKTTFTTHFTSIMRYDLCLFDIAVSFTEYMLTNYKIVG